ncbi:MAG: HD domain-containing phosphohydrolase, partial [Acholeplasma sp.]|nr:HD domain-containing phosphohydrolase [Acholeplasma sp.]
YKNIAKYARSHHERIDGKGYPDGLTGENIPLGSRIIAVADAYEAMTESRPYRQSLCQADAIKELVLNAGTQFDANIVNVFIEKVL